MQICGLRKETKRVMCDIFIKSITYISQLCAIFIFIFLFSGKRNIFKVENPSGHYVFYILYIYFNWGNLNKNKKNTLMRRKCILPDATVGITIGQYSYYNW